MVLEGLFMVFHEILAFFRVVLFSVKNAKQENEKSSKREDKQMQLQEIKSVVNMDFDK